MDLREFVATGGVALAGGTYLTVRDNVIVGNGIRHQEPVCGVFVLQGEAVRIEDNRIQANGPRHPGDPVRHGQRGGVVVLFARPSGVYVDVGPSQNLRQSGHPALRVTGNVIAAPEGRALKVHGVGPMEVEGNELTSRGDYAGNALFVLVRAYLQAVDAGTPAIQALADFIAGLDAAGLTLADAMAGSVVHLVNLGLSGEFYGQLLLYQALGASLGTPTSPGVSDMMANGNVRFADNQVVLDLWEEGETLATSAATLLSLDDIAVHGNQFDAATGIHDMDFVMTNLMAVGFSLRVADNRFKEGLLGAVVSALALGFMVGASDNQATHCVIPAGGFVDAHDNRVLMAGLCGAFANDVAQAAALFTAVGLYDAISGVN